MAMRFTVNSTELQRALSKVGGAIPSKSTVPILENFLLDLLNNVLTITATDLDISFMTSLQVQGAEDGKIAIPAKRLLDTIRSLPDVSPTFAIDTTNNKVKITTDTGEYLLTGENAKDFPSVPHFAGAEELRLDNVILKKIIYRTAFAVSTDELRPAMMGILVQARGNDLRAVSTDGHRLVKLDQKLSNATTIKQDMIVPAKALHLIGRTIEGGESTIHVNATHIQFSFDKTVLISRLIDERYPNYESVIPTENDKTMTINRESLVLSLRRVALYASATTHQVRFDVKKNSLTVMAQDLDFGGEAKEHLACEYSHDALEIGFNSNYLIDILTHLDSEKVVFKFSTPTRAGLVSPAMQQESESIIMLVMPVRLNA
jgi:DNA polymerase III subunit beta